MRLLYSIVFGLYFFLATHLPAQDLHSRFDSLMYASPQHQSLLQVKGHSHNDYERDIPFWRAYHAGMQSIEADIFLKNDTLYVAHEKDQIRTGYTLEDLYLNPLSKLFSLHNKRPFADEEKSLQLLIDLKEDYAILLPKLMETLTAYRFMIDPKENPHAIRIVISGSMPPPNKFSDFPNYIFFDGRPNIAYTQKQLERVAMISDDLRNYSNWNGKGAPKKEEMSRILQQINKAKGQGKSFRLWGTPESVNTWLILEKMGITWLNTDKPDMLKDYLETLESNRYQQQVPHDVYKPSYRADGSSDIPKNIILLIGDGMGLSHIQAAKVANHGELNMTQVHHIGFSNTTSRTPGNTDSGAGGSAIATGQKTYNGMISTDTLKNALPKIPELLSKYGMVSGIVTTGDASDATPAVFYASHPDRNASEEISNMLLQSPSLHLLAGALPQPFRSEEKRKAWEAQLKEKGYYVSRTAEDFGRSTHSKNVLYTADTVMRTVKDGRTHILRELVQQGIHKLARQGTGFFLMAEGAQIDYGGHARDLKYVATETLDFDQAVGAALQYADQMGNTLVIVTADHETGALTLLDADSTKGYLQGHFASNDHSSAMVPVMAYGPGAQYFTGYYENTELFHRIMSLFDQKK